MNFDTDKKIFRKLNRKGFSPRHVAEVGVYLPQTCNVYDYIIDDVRCTLVEPDADSVAAIREHFADRTNVTLHPVAVYDRTGELELVRRKASTFVGELSDAPAIVNDEYEIQAEDKFKVPTQTFDLIDDGTIDLLSVDIEGSEWFVIKHMVSRPGVISLETHGAIYINPHLDEILGWMRKHDYVTWYKDKSDTVFVRRGEFGIDLRDKIQLFVVDLRIRLRRARKTLTRRLTRKKTS